MSIFKSALLAMASGAALVTASIAPASAANSPPAPPPEVYSVGRYGGVCNGDSANGARDTAAINAIFADIRALPNNSTHPHIVFPGNPTRGFGACYITSTINATSAGAGADPLSSQNHLTIEHGRLECHTTGTPCFDMSGASYFTFRDVTINSPSGATESSYGLQIARLRTGVPAGAHYFDGVVVQGFYTKAAVMTFASEDNVWNFPWISNNDTTSPSANYALIDDGCNHFNVTSQFQTVTIPPNTPTSDLSNVFIGGQISSGVGANTVAPLFLCHTMHHEFLDTYINSNSAYAIHFFGVANGNSEMLTLDVHVESAIQHTFLFENNASPNMVVNGFKFRDSATNSSISVFDAKKDINGVSTLSSITIHNFDVEIGRFASGANVKLFDDASLWAVDSGTISLPLLSNWSPPSSSSAPVSTSTSERVCISDQNPICQTPTWTLPLNRNPDFVIDQANEGNPNTVAVNGALVIDGWREHSGGAMLSSLTFQRSISLGSKTNFPFQFSLRSTVAATKTLIATDFYKITTAIEGTDVIPMRWGSGSQGTPIIIDYCINSNIAPVTIPVSITDFTEDYSYVIDNVVNVANVWQCFTNLVPPEMLSAAFARQPNLPGMKISISYGAGSTVVGTCAANVWQAGLCIATPASTNFISQPNGSSFDISYFHVFNSFVDNPELSLSFVEQLASAQHWYRKSFPVGTAPAQNTGSAVGAVTIRAPYAQATFPTISDRVSFPTMFMNGNTTPPVVTFYSPNTASANCYNATRSANAGAGSVTNASGQGFMANCALAAGDAIGDVVQFHYTADSGW